MLSPRISFVIPVLNEETSIARLLAVLESAFPQAERVVVDGGSTDQTVAQARLSCSQMVISEPGRAAQMNAGARCANGEYLFFLHADTVPRFTAQDLESCFAQRAPQWGFFAVRLQGVQSAYRMIEYCMNTRSRLTHVATGDQLIFIRRELFERVSGFADMPLMEDVECCKRLRQLSPPLVLPLQVQTSTRRWQENGIARTVLLMWGLRLAYFFGVSPSRLSRYYRGR